MSPRRKARAPLSIAGGEVQPGHRAKLELALARLPAGSWMNMPIWVAHGRRPGPRVWLDAAVHGDEINGVEIIRRTIKALDPRKLRGTVVAVPIVNVFGFVAETRYLPDGRDLNRCFPGSARGSLASRMANLFIKEVATGSDLGIDLHTGSRHRTNHPQIRADLDDPVLCGYARAFGVPLLIHASERAGSLRAACRKLGIPVLVYEGGEPQRFNPKAIRAGARGVWRVLAALDMVDPAPADLEAPPPEPTVARRTSWVRARRSGVLRLTVGLGDRVEAKQSLGVIADHFGDARSRVRAPFDGVVIGMTRNPLVHHGSALIHLARTL